MSQTITFKNGETFPIIAVYSQKELIQGAYRECFEIRMSTEIITYDDMVSLATPENLSELILTETNDETNEVTVQFLHRNFSIVMGLGMKTAPEDGTPYYFLSVAQKSDAELEIERISQENEAIMDAVVELAGIIAGEEE